MIGFVWSLIVGGIIGAVAGKLSHRNVPGGTIGNVIAGFVGSSIGNYLFGSFGPVVAGFAIVPSILGAIILLLLYAALIGKKD
ncbi:GlsB/YeaQ/YmgE family stress response membrane protein [Allofustis seminis]|uniref:GlsB/YeaQ/YmgE family stress response membrane protein n=1 Tax=Allofustis seminis TaxID=166939 RepID=UPI00036BCEC2|nr:GlsB/YeaQ/YmgE family stress response membrane protein [Allofustis seminis]